MPAQSAAAVDQLFDSVTPRGPTPIGDKLESLLLEYIGGLERAKERAEAGDGAALKEYKPVNYIVLTDGAPSTFSLILGFHTLPFLESTFEQRMTQNRLLWRQQSAWTRRTSP